MVSKIFVGILVLCSIIMAVISGYSYSWLQSIGQPAAAVAGYQYHAGWSWPFLWISWVTLLALGNAVFWGTRRAWALWLSFAYFAVWIAVRSFWLEPAHSTFSSSAGIAASQANLSPILAVILIFVAGAVTFFDQFLVDRMYQRFYGPDAPQAKAAETTE